MPREKMTRDLLAQGWNGRALILYGDKNQHNHCGNLTFCTKVYPTNQQEIELIPPRTRHKRGAWVSVG